MNDHSNPITPRFERAAFEESIANDQPLLRRLVELFLDAQPPRIVELAAQLANCDMDAGRRTAHTVVGSFRTMMMPGLADIARDIENKLKAGQLEPARQSYTLLELEFSAVLRELEALRNTLPTA